MFSHSSLEQDIERLAKEVGEKKNLPENKGISSKEIIKQTLEPLVKQSVSNQSQQPAGAQSNEENALPGYMKTAPEEQKLQVEKLVDAVFHEGLGRVVQKARQSGAFILDSFHDALSDKLHEELKKRKLI